VRKAGIARPTQYATILLGLTHAFAKPVSGRLPLLNVASFAQVIKDNLLRGAILINCLDVDECNTQNPCGPGTYCNNTAGGYNCPCLSGYSGSPCTGTHAIIRPSV
jgi:hypothetical protein